MFPKDRLIVALILFGTPLAFFWPMFTTCGLGPREDDLIQYFPSLAWLGGHLQVGQFPLWNGLAYGGYPAIGDPHEAGFEHAGAGLGRDDPRRGDGDAQGE